MSPIERLDVSDEGGDEGVRGPRLAGHSYSLHARRSHRCVGLASSDGRWASQYTRSTTHCFTGQGGPWWSGGRDGSSAPGFTSFLTSERLGRRPSRGGVVL